MASADLMRLYKLHLIDAGIVEVKKKAAAFEAGKKIQAELEEVRKTTETANAEYHRVHGDQTDLELSNQQIDDKIKSIDKQLFSGSIVNPKEIDAFEHQKQNLKLQRDKNDEKILDLWDEVPKFKTVADEANAKLKAKEKQLEDWKQQAVAYKAQLEAKYKELTAKRPAAATGISANLIAKYDAVRQRHGGIGMARITNEITCEECGSRIPEKSITDIQDERTIVTCEGCYRILYWTGGVI